MMGLVQDPALISRYRAMLGVPVAESEPDTAPLPRVANPEGMGTSVTDPVLRERYSKMLSGARPLGRWWADFELDETRDPEQDDANFIEKLAQKLGEGGLEVAHGFLRGGPSTAVFAGGVLDKVGLDEAGKWIAEKGVRGGAWLDDHLASRNPDLFTKLCNGAGSMLSFFIPGAAVSRAAAGAQGAFKLAHLLKTGGGLTKAADWMGRIAGAGTMGALESFYEVGSMMEQHVVAGMTPEQALAATQKAILPNIGLAVATNVFHFSRLRRAGRLLTEALSEGSQEMYQGNITDWTMGHKTALDALKPDHWEEGLIGAMLGGGLGTIRSAEGYRQEGDKRPDAAGPEPDGDTGTQQELTGAAPRNVQEQTRTEKWRRDAMQLTPEQLTEAIGQIDQTIAAGGELHDYETVLMYGVLQDEQYRRRMQSEIEGLDDDQLRRAADRLRGHDSEEANVAHAAVVAEMRSRGILESKYLDDYEGYFGVPADEMGPAARAARDRFVEGPSRSGGRPMEEGEPTPVRGQVVNNVPRGTRSGGQVLPDIPPVGPPRSGGRVVEEGEVVPAPLGVAPEAKRTVRSGGQVIEPPPPLGPVRSGGRVLEEGEVVPTGIPAGPEAGRTVRSGGQIIEEGAEAAQDARTEGRPEAEPMPEKTGSAAPAPASELEQAETRRLSMADINAMLKRASLDERRPTEPPREGLHEGKRGAVTREFKQDRLSGRWVGEIDGLQVTIERSEKAVSARKGKGKPGRTKEYREAKELYDQQMKEYKRFMHSMNPLPKPVFNPPPPKTEYTGESHKKFWVEVGGSGVALGETREEAIQALQEDEEILNAPDDVVIERLAEIDEEAEMRFKGIVENRAQAIGTRKVKRGEGEREHRGRIPNWVYETPGPRVGQMLDRITRVSKKLEDRMDLHSEDRDVLIPRLIAEARKKLEQQRSDDSKYREAVGSTEPSGDVYLGDLVGSLQQLIDRAGGGRAKKTTERRDWRTGSMQEAIDRDFGTGEQGDRELVARVKAAAVGSKDAAIQRMVDDLHLAKMAANRALGGKGMKTLDQMARSDSFYHVMRGLVRGWSAIGSRFVEGGVRSFTDHTQVIHRGIEPILKERAYEIAGNWQDFNNYLKAKRLVAVYRAKPEKFSDEEAAKIPSLSRDVSEYEKRFKNWSKAAGELNAYADALVQYLHEAGALSAEDVAEITGAYEFYTPLHIVSEADMRSRYARSRPGQRAVRGVKTMKEVMDEAKTAPPVATLIRNTYFMVNAAQMNHAKIKLAELVRAIGDAEEFGEILDPDALRKPQMMSRGELYSAAGVKRGQKSAVRQVLDAFDVDPTIIQEALSAMDLPANVAEQMKKIYVADTQMRDGMMAFLEDGQLKVMRVHEDVFDAFVNLRDKQFDRLYMLCNKLTSVLRRGAILTPQFMFRNPLRDVVHAAVVANKVVDIRQRPDKWVAEFGRYYGAWARGFRSSFLHDMKYDEWVMSGAAMADLTALDRDTINRRIQGIMAEGVAGNPLVRTFRSPKDFIAGLAEASQVMEEATRLAVFDRSLARLLKAGVPEYEARIAAGIESREASVDFAKMGEDARKINMLIPFFSANIGGQVKLWNSLLSKNATDKTGAWMRATALITLPSALLWALNNGDDEDDWYQKIPVWERNAFWHVKIKGHIWRLPKPFEAGMFFGSSLERFLDQEFKNRPDEVKKWMAAFVADANPLNLYQVVPPLSAAFELAVNKDYWRNADIVKGELQKLPARLQFTSQTSDFAKLLGEIVNVSPLKVDYYVRAAAGGLGEHAVELASLAVRPILDEHRIKPADRKLIAMPLLPDITERSPVIKGFVSPSPAPYDSYTEEFYRIYEKAEQAHYALQAGALGKLSRQRTGREVGRYKADPNGRLYPFLHRMARKAAGITRAIKMLETTDSDRYSPELKTEMRDRLYVARSRLLQQAVQVAHEVLKEKK